MSCASTTPPEGRVEILSTVRSQPLEGASCEVETGAGKWAVTTPGSVQVGLPQGDSPFILNASYTFTAEIDRLIRAHGLATRVTLTGLLQGAEKMAALTAALQHPPAPRRRRHRRVDRHRARRRADRHIRLRRRQWPEQCRRQEYPGSSTRLCRPSSPLPSSTRSCQSKPSTLIAASVLRIVTSLPSGVITRGEEPTLLFEKDRKTA